MPESLRLAAIDLGAESGRVVLGGFDGERVELEVVHRFANRPVWLPDGLHWNLPSLFCEALTGLGSAASTGLLHGVGVDAWGCDYALLDDTGQMLGLPFHYRDERTSREVLAEAHARVPRAELYRRTGIQTMPINTVYQLASEAGRAAAAVADRIALVPDLFAMWLTGTLVNEATAASTTGLLEAGGIRWATDLIERLGLPARPFAGEVVEPGTEIGSILAHHSDRAGEAAGTTVRSVAGHDTASAFVAAPLRSRSAAVLSSGTWSLLGLETDEPQLDERAAGWNLTNERGVDNTIRLLRNVMGLWLVQECRRSWSVRGIERGYDEIQDMAAAARPEVPVFDPDHDSLLHPADDMPERITALCTAGGQNSPADDGELLRAIFTSLACKYRLVLEQLEAVTQRQVDSVHVVGGGARNVLLCQLTADVLQREVLAGPVEATALGNVLVQAAAAGELNGLADMRVIAGTSADLHRYEPAGDAASREIYDRFLSATGQFGRRAMSTHA